MASSIPPPIQPPRSPYRVVDIAPNLSEPEEAPPPVNKDPNLTHQEPEPPSHWYNEAMYWFIAVPSRLRKSVLRKLCLCTFGTIDLWGLGKAGYMVFVIFYTLWLTILVFPVFITSIALFGGDIKWMEPRHHKRAPAGAGAEEEEEEEEITYATRPIKERLLLPGMVPAARVGILALLWMLSCFIVGKWWRQEQAHRRLLGSPLNHWAILVSALLLLTPIIILYAYFFTEILRSDIQHSRNVYWIRGVEASVRRVLYFGLILLIWGIYFAHDYTQLKHIYRRVHKYIILTLLGLFIGVILGLLKDIAVLWWMSKFIYKPDRIKEILFSAYELLLKDHHLVRDELFLKYPLPLSIRDPILKDMLFKEPILINYLPSYVINQLLTEDDHLLLKGLLLKEPRLLIEPRLKYLFNDPLLKDLKFDNHYSIYYLLLKDTLLFKYVLLNDPLLLKDVLLENHLLLEDLINNDPGLKDVLLENPLPLNDVLLENSNLGYDLLADPTLKDKNIPKEDNPIDDVFSLQDIDEFRQWLIIGVPDQYHNNREQKTRPKFPLPLKSFFKKMAKLKDENPYPNLEKRREDRLRRIEAFPSKLNEEFKLRNILSAMLMVTQFLFALVIWLFITGLASTKVVVALGSLFAGVTFVFGDTCKTFFQCCIFSFLTCPLDIGDIVWIDDNDEKLEVKTINVMLTTFIKKNPQKAPQNNKILKDDEEEDDDDEAHPKKNDEDDEYEKTIVYPNSELATKKIIKGTSKRAETRKQRT